MSTEYVLLTREGDGGRWVQHPKTVEAGSSDSAIRKVARSGDWVAIPARSFHPITVEVETKEQLRLAPAAKTEVKGEPAFVKGGTV